jgi:hypothetical protein
MLEDVIQAKGLLIFDDRSLDGSGKRHGEGRLWTWRGIKKEKRGLTEKVGQEGGQALHINSCWWQRKEGKEGEELHRAAAATALAGPWKLHV